MEWRIIEGWLRARPLTEPGRWNKIPHAIGSVIWSDGRDTGPLDRLHEPPVIGRGDLEVPRLRGDDGDLLARPPQETTDAFGGLPWPRQPAHEGLPAKGPGLAREPQIACGHAPDRPL